MLYYLAVEKYEPASLAMVKQIEMALVNAAVCGRSYALQESSG